MGNEVVRRRPSESEVPIRHKILDQAASLFADHGYDATSVRDIAAAVGITAPALYNHFRSKEELFCATHARGMATITRAVEAAIDRAATPWDRLEAAGAAHCTSLLGSTGYRTIITPQFPKFSKEARQELVAQRDSYERLVKRLIDDLQLPDNVEPSIFRMHLLGALNWTTTWYHDGGAATPDAIGRSIVRLLRQAIEGVQPNAVSGAREKRQ